MKQLLIIEGRLPGMNELLKAVSRHWAAGYQLKELHMQKIQWACINQHIKPVPAFQKPVITVMCFEPNARRDEDNVKAGACKIVLDALQKAGILQGDGRKYITLVQPPVEVDRKNPRIEVSLETEE